MKIYNTDARFHAFHYWKSITVKPFKQTDINAQFLCKVNGPITDHLSPAWC